MVSWVKVTRLRELGGDKNAQGSISREKRAAYRESRKQQSVPF